MQPSKVLDVLVQLRLDRAGRKLMRKLLRKQGFAPAEIATDGLRPHGAAFTEIGLTVRYEQGPRKNNRAEVSRRLVRQQEHEMQRFKSPGSAQRFLSIHSAVCRTINLQRHLISRRTLRAVGAEAIAQWHAATSAAWGRPYAEGLCAPAGFP